MTSSKISSDSAQIASDFRSFIEALRQEGDLADIEIEVDPNLEVGAITRKSLEARDRAPLFHNVKGARNGLFRIMGAPGGLRPHGPGELGRLALHAGLPSHATPRELVEKSVFVQNSGGIPPVLVPTGPCKENKIFGDDIDLLSLPIPLLHRGDGGRYIQTFGLNCVQSPDGTWLNWSINRSMVIGKNTLTGPLIPTQDIAKVHRMWRDKGQDTPWALALGVPPAAAFVGAMPLPDKANEVDYAGAFAGRPIEVVKCETNDLLVPANSEIILEGTISQTEKSLEGPFTEMLGYVFPGSARNAEVFRVNCMTYRDNPILPVCPAGRMPDETQTMMGPTYTAEMLRVLRQHDFPILDVWYLIETQTEWMVVQVDTVRLSKSGYDRETFCSKIGSFMFNTRAGHYPAKIVLVGPDIDIHELQDVLWAYCTRCHPQKDVYNFPDTNSPPFMPYTRGEKKGGKVLMNCLLPCEFEGKQDWITGDFQNSYPEDVKSRVEDRWEQMGFRTKAH